MSFSGMRRGPQDRILTSSHRRWSKLGLGPDKASVSMISGAPKRCTKKLASWISPVCVRMCGFFSSLWNSLRFSFGIGLFFRVWLGKYSGLEFSWITFKKEAKEDRESVLVFVERKTLLLPHSLPASLRRPVRKCHT